MVAKLTGSARANNEERRISRLTAPHDTLFKLIISHQIESKYCFNSVHNRAGKTTTMRDKVQLLSALGRFLDNATKLSISEVENKYRRTPDHSDETYDPETGTKVKVEHFCLYTDTNTPKNIDSVRVHGYFRTNGYFIVTRLDWFHNVHKK